jgi:hypothetical protein
MILLPIFAYTGGARPSIGTIFSVTFAQAMMTPRWAFFEPHASRSSPSMERGKIFSFLDLPSGAYPRDVRWFLIPNH